MLRPSDTRGSGVYCLFLTVQDTPFVSNVAITKGCSIQGTGVVAVSGGVDEREIIAACCKEDVCGAVVGDVFAGLLVVLQPQY